METVDDVMQLVRVLSEEAVRVDREYRVVLYRARAGVRPSAEGERLFRMAEMMLENNMDEMRRRVGLLHERAEEIERNRAVNALDLDRGYCNYDTQTTARHWRDLVILPEDSGAAA